MKEVTLHIDLNTALLMTEEDAFEMARYVKGTVYEPLIKEDDGRPDTGTE